MSTIGVAGNVALGTLASIFAAQREHITTVTTPVRANIGQRFETMRNAMIDLLFISFLYYD